MDPKFFDTLKDTLEESLAHANGEITLVTVTPKA